MPGCEKCWTEASDFAETGHETKVSRYHEVLEKRKGRPCHVTDCPKRDPEHYSFRPIACPSCGCRCYRDTCPLHDEKEGE